MNQLIYDIGMHSGRDTEFYLKKGFSVIAVEADAKHIANAKKKFENEIEEGRLVIIDKAIAPAGVDEITFYVNDKFDDWGTIKPDWNRGMSSDFKNVTVKTVQLQSIIETYGMPYYMKIDIEGSDMLCLQSLQQMNASPHLLSIELLTPSNYKGQKMDCLEIICSLYALGYRKFKISDQSRLRYVKCPRPALEGDYIDFNFEGGFVSGTFGKELTGPFMSVDEVSKKYLDYFYSPPLLSFDLLKKIIEKTGIATFKRNTFYRGGWFDLHAYKEE